MRAAKGSLSPFTRRAHYPHTRAEAAHVQREPRMRVVCELPHRLSALCPMGMRFHSLSMPVLSCPTSTRRAACARQPDRPRGRCQPGWMLEHLQGLDAAVEDVDDLFEGILDGTRVLGGRGWLRRSSLLRRSLRLGRSLRLRRRLLGDPVGTRVERMVLSRWHALFAWEARTFYALKRYVFLTADFLAGSSSSG